MYFRTRVQLPAPPPFSSIKTGGSAPRSLRLHDSSTVFRGAVQQPDRRVERRRAQVHIALRHRQVRVSGELLDRPRRRATHRQVRAERVTKDVHPVVLQPRLAGRSLGSRLHDLPLVREMALVY